MSSTVVLGGGIAGLSAAFYLRNSAPILIEGSSRLGGWIRTNRRENGILFEHGPRTIRPAGVPGVNTLNLIEDLGLEDDVRPIDKNHPAAKNRMIYAKGKLNPLPNSLSGLFKIQSPFTKPLVLCAWTDFRAPRKISVDESTYDFFKRRFGADIAEYAVSSMLCGICAGSAKDISVKMLFRALFEAEQKHGSVIKGLPKEMKNKTPNIHNIQMGELSKKATLERWSIYSLDNGLETLPECMEHRLREAKVDIRTSNPCVKIKFSKDSVELELKSGDVVKAKNIICALPSALLAPLLKDEHPDLALKLSEQQSVSVGVVNLRYKGRQNKAPAFGFLVPPIEQNPLLGVIFDSDCFENEDGDTVLTAMMGGHWFHPQFTDKSPQDLADVAVENIGKIMGIKDDPVDVNPVIQKDCIPQYTVGHYERLDAIDLYIEKNKLPLHLVGASYRGIGINDVILSAKAAVDKILK